MWVRKPGHQLPAPGEDGFRDLQDPSAFDERFEQLSAYLDGELSAAERRTVEAWLATDGQARILYAQLQALQIKFEQLPAPPASLSATQLADRVIKQADRRRFLIPKIAAAVVAMLGSGWLSWEWTHPQPLVSLEDPPITVATLPPTTRLAGKVLLGSSDSQDAYTILFVRDQSN